ncbi:Rhodanese-like domain-containing protein [Elsinoe ampelina]|uniref:Rhodanese-like domain-containing protein n=1 Tax=Elsinoe ampelina TaxID=302913 RepID=A0A6A6GR22_9PEZI|nr:Rhodanese-like domain-containing protein [Elsinoe ampelina]
MSFLRPLSRAIPSTPTRLIVGPIARPSTFRAQLPTPPSRTFSSCNPLLSKPFDFDAVQSLASAPTPNTVLIDVREPSEFAEGHIPNAINIPVKSQPDALLLPEDEFEDRFGFAKPPTDAETVFYCRAGVRSKAASELAKRAGYSSVGDYAGSWLDWTAKGGKVVR